MSHRKIYSSKLWKAIRRSHLNNNPLCVYCLDIGLLTPANVVDHIIPHRNNTKLAFDVNNLQSCCDFCHNKHADAKDKGKKVTIIDENGYGNDW